MAFFPSRKAELTAVSPWRRWLQVGLAAVAIVLVGGWILVWAYHRAKDWRAEQLAGQAFDLLARHDRAQSDVKLMAAYHLAPFDPKVERMCARYMTTIGDAHALGFFRLLLLQPHPSRDDQRDAAAACLAFGDLDSAQTLVDALTAHGAEARDFTLQAEVLWRQHNAPQAIATMRRALELDRANRADQLLLAEMLTGSRDPQDAAEAVQSLESLARNSDAESLEALLLLSRDHALDETRLGDVLQRLRHHPLLDDSGRMAAWELEQRLNPARSPAILQQAADYFRPLEAARRAVAARWLYDQGQPALALTLAPLPDADTNQDLFNVREDAQARLGRWQAVRTELDDPAVPLPAHLVLLYKARCAVELGRPAESDADWNLARDEGAGQPAILAELTRYAVLLGLDGEARNTLARMEPFPSEAKALYVSLLQAEAGRDNRPELLATLRQMIGAFPAEPEPRNDWAYLNLLLNQNTEEATATAKELVRDYPTLLSYRSTLALACLRHHDSQGAARAYAGLQIDWAHCPASWKMVYATVLAAGGKKDEGRALVRDVTPGQLRPAELEFFKTYFPES
jgi:hypothetical protein